MTLGPIQFFTFVILAGVLIMLTLTWLAPMPASTPKEWSADVPQWFAVQAMSTTIAPNGKPKHQVKATKLIHFDQQKQTQIVEAQATVFNLDAPPWQLQADHGLAQHASALEDMQEMDLWGNVIIWREAAAQTPISELTTEYLKYFPELNIVESDVLVNFRYGQHTTSAVGMYADLNTEHIKLLNTVKSQYVPKKSL